MANGINILVSAPVDGLKFLVSHLLFLWRSTSAVAEENGMAVEVRHKAMESCRHVDLKQVNYRRTKLKQIILPFRNICRCEENAVTEIVVYKVSKESAVFKRGILSDHSEPDGEDKPTTMAPTYVDF